MVTIKHPVTHQTNGGHAIVSVDILTQVCKYKTIHSHTLFLAKTVSQDVFKTLLQVASLLQHFIKDVWGTTDWPGKWCV